MFIKLHLIAECSVPVHGQAQLVKGGRPYRLGCCSHIRLCLHAHFIFHSGLDVAISKPYKIKLWHTCMCKLHENSRYTVYGITHQNYGLNASVSGCLLLVLLEITVTLSSFYFSRRVGEAWPVMGCTKTDIQYRPKFCRPTPGNLQLNCVRIYLKLHFFLETKDWFSVLPARTTITSWICLQVSSVRISHKRHITSFCIEANFMIHVPLLAIYTDVILKSNVNQFL